MSPQSSCSYQSLFFFFFNDTATTEIYTLSLHDALPIYSRKVPLLPDAPINQRDLVLREFGERVAREIRKDGVRMFARITDRKSTRLNSSHGYISYAVFCLKKKKNNKTTQLNYKIAKIDTIQWRL